MVLICRVVYELFIRGASRREATCLTRMFLASAANMTVDHALQVVFGREAEHVLAPDTTQPLVVISI